MAFLSPDFSLELENNTQIDGQLGNYSGSGFTWTYTPETIPSNGGSAKPHVRPLYVDARHCRLYNLCC